MRHDEGRTRRRRRMTNLNCDLQSTKFFRMFFKMILMTDFYNVFLNIFVNINYFYDKYFD